MTALARRKLPDRRENRSGKMAWHTASGDLPFHVCVGYEPSAGGAFDLGPPLEIFLTPSRRAGRTGAAMYFYAGDIGECLSLHLQHGHTLASLRDRFKPGSLARAVAEFAWALSAHAGAPVDLLPAELRPLFDRIQAGEIGDD